MFAAFSTVPVIVKFPEPLIPLALVPPVNVTLPAFTIPFSATTAFAFVVNEPFSTTVILSVAVIAPPLSLVLVNVPKTFISFWFIVPVVFATFDSSSIVVVPVPLITFLFVPPVNIKLPSFVTSSVALIVSALVVKLPLSVTVIVLCLTSPLFNTSPVTLSSPSPVTLLVLVPPVNVTLPAFTIPLVATTALAFVVTEPFSTTVILFVAVIAFSVSLLLVNSPLTSISF